VRGEGAAREDGEKRSPKGMIVCKYFTTDGWMLVVEPTRLEAAPTSCLSSPPHTRDEKEPGFRAHSTS
jgi:hypothetical protein